MEWSQEECEVIVADYFSMLNKELSGEQYSKAEHRKRLRSLLNNRSEGSIEYKHQNISAVLLSYGHAYIAGYKPAWNYQKLLEKIVSEQLHGNLEVISELEDKFIQEMPANLTVDDWRSLLVDAPERKTQKKWHQIREPSLRYVNFLEKEKRNRQVGDAGEKFILEFEKARLSSVGRKDLVPEIEWTSKVKGDGAGYDIRSFRGDTDEELFIEVKTTNSGKYQPFLMTDNEVEFSKYKESQYSLYRVFEFSKYANIYTLSGDISSHVNLQPKLYQAMFTK